MPESSLMSLLLYLGTGGTAMYLFFAGLIMLGLTFFMFLILFEVYQSAKETALS
ncbi:hypothetical protein HYU07_04940 [Candidatus Woesearchaeota archaeon]|nr:hypothetical protein [Candidatus Woesearchaeota archaeon]